MEPNSFTPGGSALLTGAELNEVLQHLVWPVDAPDTLPPGGKPRATAARALLKAGAYLTGTLPCLRGSVAGAVGAEIVGHRMGERRPAGSRGAWDWPSTTLFLICQGEQREPTGVHVEKTAALNAALALEHGDVSALLWGGR